MFMLVVNLILGVVLYLMIGVVFAMYVAQQAGVKPRNRETMTALWLALVGGWPVPVLLMIVVYLLVAIIVLACSLVFLWQESVEQFQSWWCRKDNARAEN